MAEWIEFIVVGDDGLWLICPRCRKKVRNLRMAMGSHAAWCLKHPAPPLRSPEEDRSHE